MAVVNGRTRSLVERFERKEKVETDDICTPDRAPGVVSEPAETPSPQVKFPPSCTKYVSYVT